MADMSEFEPQFILPYIGRVGWSARNPRSTEPLKLPITHVRYTYTGTTKCLDDEECTKAVEDLQRADMKAGLPDIKYNFLVGAAGTVFEGRGWRYDAHRPPEYDHLKGKCLDIAYIGDYSKKVPPWEQQRSGLDLLRFGVKRHLIHPAYNIIPMRKKDPP